ncbi:MAG TPA: 4Fe-4S binding protein [bacterium]|nr:4Fe-4S binding protein [bacterium]
MKTKLMPAWTELELGCAVLEPGSSREYKTGDWRSFYPKTDEDKCIACGLCWIYCPDDSRRLAPRQHKHENRLTDQYYDFNFNYCKGCGICAAECPTGAIVMVEGGQK